MLQYKNGIVSTISGRMLGWFDGPTWRPSQVIVGMRYDEGLLSAFLSAQVKDFAVYQLGQRLATVKVGVDGKISDLTLDAQKLPA